MRVRLFRVSIIYSAVVYFLTVTHAMASGGAGQVSLGGGAPNTVCVNVTEQSKYLSKICIDSVSVDWEAGALLEEPLLDFSVIWQLSGGSGFEGSSGLNGQGEGDVFRLLPTPAAEVLEALAEVRITDMDLTAEVSVKDPDDTYETAYGSWRGTLDTNWKEKYLREKGVDVERFRKLEAKYDALPYAAKSGNFNLPIEVGALGKAGQKSFNITGSPSWGKVFTNGVGSRCSAPFAEPDEAKAVYGLGFDLTILTLCGFKVSSLSSVDAALEKTCQAWKPGTESFNKCRAQCSEGWRRSADESGCEREGAVGRLNNLLDENLKDEEGEATVSALNKQLDQLADSMQFEKDAAEKGGKIEGEIRDAISGDSIGGVRLEVIQDGKTLSTVLADEQGGYSVPLLDGRYKVRFSKEGYLPIAANVNVRSKEVTSLVRLQQVPKEFAGKGIISGRVKNAFSGAPVSGVQLGFVDGVNADSGQIVAVAVTNADGDYRLELKAGNYTLVGQKDNYATVSGPVVAIGKQERDNQNFAIAPLLQSGEVRIVLSWGSSPNDLDSHLETPSGLHVNYKEKGNSEARLDTDDTNGYGPETITIYEPRPGKYRYYVHRYTDDESLRYSDARVEFYGSAGLVRTFNVPSLSSGSDYWRVITFEVTDDWLSVGPTNLRMDVVNSRLISEKGNLPQSPDNTLSRGTPGNEMKKDSKDAGNPLTDFTKELFK